MAAELEEERRVRHPALLKEDWSQKNSHQRTLEVLLEAYSQGKRVTSHDINVRIGRNYAPDHVGKLRKRYGYEIRNERRDRVTAYYLFRAVPTPPPQLPSEPRPSRADVNIRRRAVNLPEHRCDFCLTEEAGDLRLQREHGQPSMYFGTSTTTRWLLACGSCNTRKREACQTCPNKHCKSRDVGRCDSCSWGNPNGSGLEHSAGRPVLVVPATTVGQEALRQLRERASKTGLTLEQALAAVLAEGR